MNCHVCGSGMASTVTDLPFKVSETTIVILKDLPVVQCQRCGAYSLEDAVMERVDQILGTADARAELEIIRFAA